jgi:hypothetical protein
MSGSDQYVYCLLDVSDTDDPSMETAGIDGEPVDVVTTGDVGVVTHECDGLYDSDDRDQLTQWLLTHQSVVDAAGDSFGTPIPMRFDTVFEGGRASVEQWVATHREEIDDTLDRLARHWEYRVTLLWDREAFTSQVTDEDAELRELARRTEEATSGTGYMIQKQYEQRLRERERDRRSDLTEALLEAVDPVVVETVELSTDNSRIVESREEDLDRVARLGVLTHEDDEETLGNQLDEVAAIDTVTIRFTGPWPPYAFAPEFG